MSSSAILAAALLVLLAGSTTARVVAPYFRNLPADGLLGGVIVIAARAVHVFVGVRSRLFVRSFALSTGRTRIDGVFVFR